MDTNQPQPKLSETILARIEAGEVSPRSRRYFFVRAVFVWVSAVLSIVIGALSVATIIFRAVNVRNVLPPQIEATNFFEVVMLLPYLWLAILALFSYVAYRELRQTRQGYKYELMTIVGGLLLVSAVLGSALFAVGGGYVLDRAVRTLPFHSDLETVQRNGWLRPETGHLIGEVVALDGAAITLIDPTDQVWLVVLDDAPRTELPVFAVVVGDRIGVRGYIDESASSTFVACHYRPLPLRGRGFFAKPPQSIERPPRPSERIDDTMRTSECEDVRPLSR